MYPPKDRGINIHPVFSTTVEVIRVDPDSEKNLYILRIPSKQNY